MGRKISDMQTMQALPLSVKILLTQRRIRDWVNEYGIDGVYVSFSGGKDSTVLTTIAREMYPDIKAVFVDTGLEYPEIRDFVRTWSSVKWIRPKMTFRQVIEKYGYPFIGKEISNTIYGARNGKTPHESTRMMKLKGEYKDKNGGKSEYNCQKYRFMLDAPFEVSDGCCNAMKKQPTEAYERSTGRKPILAMMTCESRKRLNGWIKTGCNAFNAKRPQSNPMAFWTEQDVLQYIYQRHIQIASVYGDVVKETEIEGQLDFEDLGIFDLGVPVLKTTGCKRTGCMFCGFGCHLEAPGEGRFERMKETHPKQYEWIMKPWENGGLGYKGVIDWMNEHGNLNIRY